MTDSQPPGRNLRSSTVNKNDKATDSEKDFVKPNRKRRNNVLEAESEQRYSIPKKAKMSELEESLQNLLSKEDPNNHDIIGAILKSCEITRENLKPLEATIAEVAENRKNIQIVQQNVSDLEIKHDKLADEVAILKQAQHETQASITGFQSPPEAEALKEALVGLFQIDPNAIIRIASFVIKSRGSEIVITNVYFTNTVEKAKLFVNKMSKGRLEARNFLPSLADGSGAANEIFIGHKLTKSNLKIRKALIELVKSKKIISKRFRDNKFQIQMKPEGHWIDIPSIETLNSITQSATISAS